ncbi:MULTISPECIES: hypothetical protein [Pantoea]|uniref:hypothetical protein n=1 Tax=Pantoea TaxID=53335 RepID=UPI0012E73B54|nr:MULTISPECIES: hypothetical protein [Pantoea]MCH9407162.1 hypothetical protein [Pantoea agglomerans]WNK31830.1 hypothetical protein RM157_06335 [Pantoea agglomerans]WNK36452.1 hypothetical protein RM158_06420 [Pantoea agglomerans]WNK63642.1 hypothetical protein RM152_06305 [Pantoea agglomerans]
MEKQSFNERFDHVAVTAMCNDEFSKSIAFWLGEYLSGNIKGAISTVFEFEFKLQYAVFSIWMSLFKQKADVENLAKIILLFKSEHEFKNFKL